MKLDPIIAVHDVEISSKWYQEIFGWSSKHGGSEFDVLVSSDKEIILCLHKWAAHEHPPMVNSKIKPGNGLILYFRAENIDEIRNNLIKIEYGVESEIQLNPNSHKKEFSVVDPNGYYLTISEFHKYEG